jgi:rhodanese-related sulfurtransferase
MEHFIEFVKNHWQLWLALVAVIAWIIFEEAKSKMGGANRLTAQDAAMLISHENALVVDFRSADSFANGHILGAINVLPTELLDKIATLAADKNRPLILLGPADSAAISFSIKLSKQGYTNINILTGGLAAWREAKLPLSKK